MAFGNEVQQRICENDAQMPQERRQREPLFKKSNRLPGRLPELAAPRCGELNELT